jgi:hypothetical protein
MGADDTIAELRARIEGLESKFEDLDESRPVREERFGRRHLLAAAGGAVASGALSSTRAASAADGDPMILGALNTSTTRTRLVGNGLQIDQTVLDNQGTDPAIYISLPDDDGVAGLISAGPSLVLIGGKYMIHGSARTDAPGSVLGNSSGPGVLVRVQTASGLPLPGHVAVLEASTDSPNVVPLFASGGRAHLALDPLAAAGAPSAGLHDKGEVALDANSDLHVCHTTGTPGSWHRLLDDRSPSGTAAGAVVLRDSPFRLYDSRPGRQSALPGPKGVLAVGEARDLDVAGQGTPPLPADAVGVLATVTVTATGASGHLRAHATGTPPPNTSIINWDHTDQTIATTTMIRIGATGAITIRASSTATHFLVDILGWIA